MGSSLESYIAILKPRLGERGTWVGLKEEGEGLGKSQYIIIKCFQASRGPLMVVGWNAQP